MVRPVDWWLSAPDLSFLPETQLATSRAPTTRRLLIYGVVLDGDVVAPNQLGKIHGWYFRPDEIASDLDLTRGLDGGRIAPRTE